MPNGIESSYNNVNARALQNEQRTDAVREQNQVQIRQQSELQSEAARSEQRDRDQAAQNSELLESQTVAAPSQQTLNELDRQQAARQSENASGLGQTALNSYRSLETEQQRRDISSQVNVDITI